MEGGFPIIAKSISYNWRVEFYKQLRLEKYTEE